MTTSTKLRFRWTKRIDRWAQQVHVVDRGNFHLVVRADDDGWKATVLTWSDPQSDVAGEQERSDFTSMRDAKLWAESQVTA